MIDPEDFPGFDAAVLDDHLLALVLDDMQHIRADHTRAGHDLGLTDEELAFAMYAQQIADIEHAFQRNTVQGIDQVRAAAAAVNASDSENENEDTALRRPRRAPRLAPAAARAVAFELDTQERGQRAPLHTERLVAEEDEEDDDDDRSSVPRFSRAPSPEPVEIFPATPSPHLGRRPARAVARVRDVVVPTSPQARFPPLVEEISPIADLPRSPLVVDTAAHEAPERLPVLDWIANLFNHRGIVNDLPTPLEPTPPSPAVEFLATRLRNNEFTGIVDGNNNRAAPPPLRSPEALALHLPLFEEPVMEEDHIPVLAGDIAPDEHLFDEDEPPRHALLSARVWQTPRIIGGWVFDDEDDRSTTSTSVAARSRRTSVSEVILIDTFASRRNDIGVLPHLSIAAVLPDDDEVPPPPRLPIADCAACLDKIAHDALYIQLSCDHTFDADCITNFFERAIIDESMFPPRCCAQEIPLDGVSHLLPIEIHGRFETKAVEFRTMRRVYCAEPTCSVFLGEQTTEPGPMSCTTCSATTCSACKNAHAFEPGLTCEQSFDAEAIKDMAAQLGWKRCPSCHRFIERTEGCNHMTCLCKKEFCYVCNAGWVPRACSCPLFTR